ncbi:MAG: DEAD/DEAH box helicase [Porphyromonadaceae bacterium]|nr:DEAD/DEAH box helicase [Porphyromonadaceae bacterium]
MRFDEFNLCNEVLDGLDAMNFEKATPIQEVAIPAILDGEDILACAQTGTGKTAAYVLPVISQLQEGNYPHNAVNAVIMTPTRELAQQIDQQIEGFSYFLDISAVPIYGGTDGIVWEQQKRGMEMGADILIATPGRLLSHLNMLSADLSQVSFFILDEADRMLDMGFYDDIMQVFKELPRTCQILMFSATMPDKIKQLAQNILKKPRMIELSVSKPPESIMQTACICYENQKMPILLDLFTSQKPNRTLIFSKSKQKVKDLTLMLKRKGFNAGEMHADLDQDQREQVIRDFRNDKIDVLVATDIVARGIDIDNIGVVINYDLPNDPEDYVHRIGRTARNNESGLSITFVNEKEHRDFKVIEDFLEKELYRLPIPHEIGPGPEYNPNANHFRKGRTTGKGRHNQGKNKKGKRTNFRKNKKK